MEKTKTLTRAQVEYGDRLTLMANARLTEARTRITGLQEQLTAAIKELAEIEAETGILDVVLAPALRDAKVSLGTRGL